MQETKWPDTQNRLDSKACLVTLFMKIPQMLMIAVAGALIGSGLYLLIAIIGDRVPQYMSKTEYYIDFADGRLEAADYYNAFTWNTQLKNDLIVGNMMERLGNNYNRTEIENMITGEILSDVRYLTITVKGEDAQLVDIVSKEMQISIEEFGDRMEEFDEIYQVKNSGVNLIVTPRFTVRAVILGLVIGFLAALVYNLVHFSMGDSLYTKTDVIYRFDIPCIGIQSKKKDAKLEKEYVCNLDYVKKKYPEICVLSIAKDEMNNVRYEKVRSMNGVILMIPFGKPYVRKTLSILENMKLQDCNVVGIVLTEADDTWLKLYGVLP